MNDAIVAAIRDQEQLATVRKVKDRWRAWRCRGSTRSLTDNSRPQPAPAPRIKVRQEFSELHPGTRWP